MGTGEWRDLSDGLLGALHLAHPPIAITFLDAPPEAIPAFDEPIAGPAPDGRTGRVPAGCVFWVRSETRTFSTVADDHRNCSVGSVTHGLATLDEVAGSDDVAALLESGWVTPEAVAQIPVVTQRPGSIVYGPLAEASMPPDVVLVRVNGRQLMVLSDAIPDLRIEGKPQCHIVAVAKEQGVPAASVGCSLSRARTGMQPAEMTCAIPGPRLAAVVAQVRDAAEVDGVVARYAAADARRFS